MGGLREGSYFCVTLENKDKWFKESQAKQERAHKLLWKLIEFYIRGWWD